MEIVYFFCFCISTTLFEQLSSMASFMLTDRCCYFNSMAKVTHLDVTFIWSDSVKAEEISWTIVWLICRTRAFKATATSEHFEDYEYQWNRVGTQKHAIHIIQIYRFKYMATTIYKSQKTQYKQDGKKWSRKKTRTGLACWMMMLLLTIQRKIAVLKCEKGESTRINKCK